MALSTRQSSVNYFRVKHSFNADDDAESLLRAADRALRDKTQFINRCIRQAGPTIIKTINNERNKAVASALKEVYSPKPKPS